MNPVLLPPGGAMLATRPPPTGSATFAKTIGTLLLAFCSALTVAVPKPKATSGANATSSAANEDYPATIARARKPVGRISIANSDSEWNAYTHSAIDSAYRAVNEVLLS